MHVGYIKKGSCTHVKNLLKSGKIAKIDAEIHGGKYKLLYSEYDEDKMCIRDRLYCEPSVWI